MPLKVGAIAAIAGALAVIVGTMLHPMGADPADALAAFTEYAADDHWVTSHLTQFFGFALMFIGLLAVRDLIRNETAEWMVELGKVSGICALTAVAMLQAVDGIALKVMVDNWSNAPLDQKSNAFMAAFAVRQIEIGLASFMAILFGVTAVFFGSAIAWSKHLPTWLGWIGVVGGLGTTVGGLLFAYSGFSTTAMNFGMAFNLVAILWMIAVGVVLWRKNK